MAQVLERKLLETVVSEVLTHHKVNDLVYNFGLAVQVFDFKAFKLLALIHSVELQLELIWDPRHRSSVRFNVIDFKTSAFENVNLRRVKANIFFR